MDDSEYTIEELPPSPSWKTPVMQCLGLWVLPRLLLYQIVKSLLGKTRAIHWISESLSQKTGTYGVLYRAAFYKYLFTELGNDVYIGMGTVFSRTDIQLGDRTYIGRYCSIGWVNIQADVKIADGVRLLSGSQHHNAGDEHLKIRQINIGAGSWIGTNAVVMHDLGKNVKVAAGSVVTDDTPDELTVAGVPAQAIRWRKPPQQSQ